MAKPASAGTNRPSDPAYPHVLHIASGDLWAGAEVQLYTLVKALDELGVPVSVALLNHGMLEDKLRTAGIEVFVIDETRCSGLTIILRLARLMSERAIDVVHTHRIKENILGSLAALLAGNTPSLRTVHGVPEQDPAPGEIKKGIIHFCNRLSGKLLQKRIISVSDDLALLLARTYHDSRIVVIPNGIDIPAPGGAPPRTGRDRAMSVSGRFRIGLAGRLVPVKRVDMLIRAARHIKDHHPELGVEFLVFGDGPLRDELEALNRELGTQSLVSFQGHCDDLQGELTQLDALIMTSDNEGLPMVLLEAMASGLPIIAHAAGGMTPLLDHGECGILVQDHTPAGYAAGIHRMVTDHALRARITEQAWRRVTTDYTASRNAGRYLDVYREISRSKATA